MIAIARSDGAARPAGASTTFALIAGLGASVLFVVIGLGFRLQMYGDGSLFSYAVAVDDVWRFHWHNMPGRIASYVWALLPAENYGSLVGDPQGAVTVYGLLQFGAPLAGIALTAALDRTPSRSVLTASCLSTAWIAPLLFGAPSEVWYSHAMFWPALAIAVTTSGGLRHSTMLGVAVTALALTHEAGLLMAVSIPVGLLIADGPNPRARRAALACGVAFGAWLALKLSVPSDPYFMKAHALGAVRFVDPGPLAAPVVALLFGGGAATVALGLLMDRLSAPHRYWVAAAIVLVVVAVCWVAIDLPIHAAGRYYLRTLVAAATIAAGFATVLVIADSAAQGARDRPSLAALVAIAARRLRRLAPAVAPVTLVAAAVHVVETARFLPAWQDHVMHVTSLATAGGGARDLSATVRLQSAGREQGAAWFSTTPYLSVLVAPELAPQRLVVDSRPADLNYYWLDCATARANAAKDNGVPQETRARVATFACLHRP